MRRLVLVSAVVGLVVAMGATVCGAVPVPVEKGRIEPNTVAPAASCGCHAALLEEWSQTMHAQALTDPLYLAKKAEADKATNGALGAFCDKCHGPIGTMSGELGSAKPQGVAGEGITCSFCHQATGLQGEPANTSHLFETDGVRRAQIKDPQAPHPAAYSAFHESAEICGGCHNVDHPINGMHLESTYREWLDSGYSKEGVICQDCHMSREPGVIGPSKGSAAAGGPERDNIYRMIFVGGQVALGPTELATARLKSAATIELESPEIISAGDDASVTVKITNSGAGHYLPTGLTEVREMWLEVNARTSDGKTIMVGERRFGTVLRDAKGKYPVELWEATAIQSDDRIPPRASVTESYAFKMPEGVEDAELTAVLRYRSAPDELAEKAGVENPITDMATANQRVYPSEEAKRAAALPEPMTWPSWANIVAAVVGIGLVAGAGTFVLRRARSRG